MLQWIFGGKRKSKPGPAPDYESAKEITAKGDVKARRKLAAHEDLQPEFLYYFATDKAPEVRRTVAANPGTPLQADVILSKDSDEEVRCELGHKIGTLLPDLSESEGERVRDIVFEILETLANDQVSRVRAVISEEIKRFDNVPPRIAKMLAEDVEAQVAAPILQYSPLLTNADLLDILGKGMNSDNLVALARRRNLDESVAEAVVDKDEIPAISALLENKTAKIGEAAMGKIVDIAGPEEDLHEPLVHRGGLSERLIKRISGFVSASLLDPLIKHNALVDKEMAAQLRESVIKRLEETEEELPPTRENPEGVDFDSEEDPEFVRAKEMFGSGELTPNALKDALKKGQSDFLCYALSLVGDVPAASVQRVFDAKSSKSAMAIAWHCELGADFAVTLQRSLWRLPENKILKPGPDGNYPMSESDLDWSYGLMKE